MCSLSLWAWALCICVMQLLLKDLWIEKAALNLLCTRAGEKAGVQIWDLCQPEDVRAAQAFQAGQRGLAPRHVALALQEAVNSSSQARQTSLHAAAEAGNACMIQVR